MDEPQKPQEVPDGVLVGQEGEEELVEDDGAEVRVHELVSHLQEVNKYHSTDTL